MVLGNAAELVYEVTLVDHESLRNMLNLQHLCNLWEFINIHVDIHDGVDVVCAHFCQHWLQELARSAPVGACLQHNWLITLKILIPI